MRFKFFIMAAMVIVVLLISIFSTDRLTRFCLYTPLKVLLISLGISVIFWSISGIFFENADIKSYFTLKGKDLFFYPFFVCTSCSLASYSIFLCKLRSVRKNRFALFFCFLILPLFISSIIVQTQEDGYIPFMQMLYYQLAFIIPQIVFYIDFCKKNALNEWDKG